MKEILVTGGPVHAYLDAVKIITNRFKGGLIVELVRDLLQYDAQIHYVCAPKFGGTPPTAHERLTVHEHNGIEDYRKIVLDLAPSMDAVILGAAVANLIPRNPIKGKFPSHQYKPGDVIPINFTIAPRIIDAVKDIAPQAHLFGFKLLSGVPHDELIRAAYDIVLDARATAVIANDALRLKEKFAVTKERAVQKLDQTELGAWIWEMVNDVYYRSVQTAPVTVPSELLNRLQHTIALFHDHFVANEHGLIFGTVAIRHENGFITTGRGKKELDSHVLVASVDHASRLVTVFGDTKATLNAPLLSRLFENAAVDMIVHYHESVTGLPTFPYAPAGTVRDSNRNTVSSFNIENHGCVLLFDAAGRQL